MDYNALSNNRAAKGKGAGEVLRAASEPLGRAVERRRKNLTTTLERAQVLQNQIGDDCGKPDPAVVIRRAMRTNPVLSRMVNGPAHVASLIDIYPVYGIKCGERHRADPKGSPQERLAWSIWRSYVDDCGNQKSLIRRHCVAKLATGEGHQILVDADRGPSYEIVQGSAIHEAGNGQEFITGGEHKPIIAGKRFWCRDFEDTSRPWSPMLALCDLLMMWELLLKCLNEGARSELLQAGIIAAPDDPNSEDDWTEQYFDWVVKVSEAGHLRIPFPWAYSNGLDAPQILEWGQKVQDAVITLHQHITEMIATLGPMDKKTFLEGIGGGTHWNAVLLQRDNVQSVLWPLLELDILPDIEAWPFRPLLQNANDDPDVEINFDPEDWGLWGDWRRLVSNPDRASALFEGAKCGFVDPREWIEEIGGDPASILRPGSAGWADFEARTLITGGDDGDADAPGGVGSEAFGGPPQHESDSSEFGQPTQRGELLPVGARPGELDGWDGLGEW